MLVLVQLDLSNADITLFEDYETRVLALLENHGGKVLERLRAIDEMSEVHLIRFPHVEAFDAFRADPARAAHQDLWLKCGASSSLTEVRQLS